MPARREDSLASSSTSSELVELPQTPSTFPPPTPQVETSHVGTSRERPSLDIPPCPHTFTILRSNRRMAAETKQCGICFEELFDTLNNQVTPVKLPCRCICCKSCIEEYRNLEIKCPNRWCEVEVPIQPTKCKLCAYWAKEHDVPLLLTVRANLMSKSIEEALQELSTENKFFNLPKGVKAKLLNHVSNILTQFEWQFYSGLDLAEVLDPFLLAVDIDATKRYFGPKLYRPAPTPGTFPPRTHDPDDYPAGEEPWLAGFLRQWALDYEKDNADVKEGWAEWSKMRVNDPTSGGDWPYKRILAHTTQPDGRVVYLVKWVGKRFHDDWLDKDQLCNEDREQYDQTHGVVHPINGQRNNKRRKTCP